jgi:hypothetical protein
MTGEATVQVTPLTVVPAAVLSGQIKLPGNGLAKAQGLYQFAFVLVWVGQLIVGFVLLGVPPGENGLRISIALALPPFAVLILAGPIENGVPV